MTLVREFKPAWVKFAAAFLFVLTPLNAWELVRQKPLVYVEGTKNRIAHRPYQIAVPQALRALLATQPDATILMETSVDPEIVALTGIPLKQTINEADLSIWDEALTAPSAHAAIVLAFDGDAVDAAVKAHPEGLRVVQRFAANGQPSGTLYVSNNAGAFRISNEGTTVIASGMETRHAFQIDAREAE